MAYLDWIGKKAVVEYHQHIPLLTFEEDGNEISININENMLIKADNLLTLKALLPFYSGKIKCIYIDPPYNTGNESWIYNDSVNSLEIKEWLGKVVGKDAVDLSRHDKWLCMMYPRLVIAKELLSEDGIIFISIDDNEYPRLIYLMDEIFQHKNNLSNFIWQTEGNFDNQAKVKINHEYIVAYCKNINQFPSPPVIDPNTNNDSKLFNKFIRNTIVKNGPKNPISEIIIPVGFPTDFESGKIDKREDAWPHYDKDLLVEAYRTVNEVTVSSGWSSKKILLEYIKNNFEPVIDTKGQITRFTITKTGAIETVKERKADQSHVVSVLREFGSTQQASAFLKTLGIEFDYPKPVDLIKYLLSMNQGNDYYVMDFFAGSGTTAQAVMELNNLDGGERKFVLIEWDENIFDNICFKRVDAIAEKYDGVYRMLKLGNRVFDDIGMFNIKLDWSGIARYLFYLETNQTIEFERVDIEKGLIGEIEGKSVFLIYNASHPEKSESFDLDKFEVIKSYSGIKIVYAIQCSISIEKLRSESIIFKQIPYEIGGRL